MREPYPKPSERANTRAAPSFRRARPRGVAATTGQVKELGRELSRKEQALAEARALVTLSKNAKGLVLGGRGRLHAPDVRRQVCRLVAQAMADGARLSSACRLLGISGRSVQRWRKHERAQDGRLQARRRPANRLSDQERGLVLDLLHAPGFQGLSPRQIVPRLADQGVYLASESTMYRLLRSHKRAECAKDLRTRARRGLERRVWAPNQVWSWDITYLNGPLRGSFLYLYMMMDVFSRRIMGWKIHREERAEHAARFVRAVCEENGINPAGLVLHSDNGRPMKGTTMLGTLRQLGIMPSFSRPQVSNDNPHAEALFSLMKRHKDYPASAFSSLESACAWMARFTSWYNDEHRHGSLCFVSPNDRYFGRDDSVLARRRRVYEEARRQAPVRWSSGPRRWSPPVPVHMTVWPSVGPHALQEEYIIPATPLLANAQSHHGGILV
ncbi:IS3 family transposase [Melittangium boletus]|uniref:Mobile element protein n=1 Tax=Melittangium boletus DSM 14713 TaxID=1294270 RepID=A0A250I6X8_9BACT|nr:IS3 family transposase [Melittangium boletus]ATB26943.1 Mobile element protein [Melittangium boletus DSM 14713]